MMLLIKAFAWSCVVKKNCTCICNGKGLQKEENMEREIVEMSNNFEAFN